MPRQRRLAEGIMAKDAEEKPREDPPIWRALVAEVVGTFALVFVDCGGGAIQAVDAGGEVTAVGRAFATGLVIMAMIYSLGNASGAHFNPAVTTAFALRRVFPWRRVPLYVAAQLIGASLAAGLLTLLVGDIAPGLTTPHHGALTALGFEVVLTFFLTFVILSTASRFRVLGQNAALAVGGTIAFCALFSRPMSGASMNPARSLGPALVSGRLADQWIYLVGPLIGAAIAVAVLALTQGAETDGKEEEVARGDDRK